MWKKELTQKEDKKQLEVPDLELWKYPQEECGSGVRPQEAEKWQHQPSLVESWAGGRQSGELGPDSLPSCPQPRIRVRLLLLFQGAPPLPEAAMLGSVPRS